MIWELSSWYRLSAEGLQSVQNIWKVSGWNKKCPDKCSQIIKRIQILYDKTTHDLQSVWIWNLKFLRSARTSVHLLVRSSSRKIWSLMYGQCLLNHQNHIYIRVQWKRSNCKLQFPQLDYWPRHSPNFRTVFGILIGPFSSCEIGKTWGTNKDVNKQTNKNRKFKYPQPDLEPRLSNEQVFIRHLWWSPSSFARLEYSQVHKVRKSPI